jgi:hypothetical protein
MLKAAAVPPSHFAIFHFLCLAIQSPRLKFPQCLVLTFTNVVSACRSISDVAFRTLFGIFARGSRNFCSVVAFLQRERFWDEASQRHINTITVKNVPLEIWHDKQRNMFCLDENQLTAVCIFFFSERPGNAFAFEVANSDSLSTK